MSLKLARGNVFEKPGKWFKGAIHLHTTASDGHMSPQDAMDWHKAHGYDFVCFGDHWRVTVPADPDGRVLVIPGCELDTWTEDTIGNLHVMCVGVDGLAADARPVDRRPSCRELWDLAKSISQYRFIAHPYWSTRSAESLRSFDGLAAIEVYNHGLEVSHAMGLAEYPWHMLLNQGCRIDALAVDDAHGGPESLGGGCIMVKARSCTREAVIAALAAGDFYSTMGPELKDVQFDGLTICVRTSPARRIIFRSTQFFGAMAVAPAGGSITAADTAVDLKEMEQIRVIVEDHDGRKAWSNPFYLDSQLSPPTGRKLVGLR